MSLIHKVLSVAVAACSVVAPIALSALPAQAAVIYEKYSWSPAIYQVTDGSAIQLSFEQWSGLGNPAPRVVDWIEGSQVVKYPTNADELFMSEPGPKAARHHLTVSEYAKTGHAPQTDSGHKFFGYTWNPEILVGVNGENAVHATLQTWVDLGAPTPQRASGNLGDLFCQSPTDAAIFWTNPVAGLNDKVHLTPAQYSQAGYPAFTVCSA